MNAKKYAAVIVENRLLPNLKEVIADNHLNYLQNPSDWQLIVIGSTPMKSFIESTFPTALFEELTIEIKGQKEYNHMLVMPSFWEKLLAFEYVLIFQHDSRILRTGIEDFLKWDYIGAAWSWQKHGGNGGISLRNPKVMFNICQSFNYNFKKNENEDIWFCNILQNHPFYGKLAPREECLKFGVEQVYTLGTVTCHAIDKWLSPEQCSKILNQYKNV